MSTDKKRQRLQKRVQDAREQYDRARGMQDALRQRLKDDYGANNLREAQKDLTAMRQELKEHDANLEKMLTAFEEKYGAELDALEG